MYKLNLMNGTILNVCRLNPSTFELNSNDTHLYNLLSNNLTLAFLSREDGILEDIFVDYDLQNFSCLNDVVRFRIGPWDEVNRISNRDKKRYMRWKGGNK